MILAIDTGNTHTVLGCISSDGTISPVLRMETNPRQTEFEYAASMSRILELSGIKMSDIKGAIISSVVPTVTNTLKEAVRLMTGGVEAQPGVAVNRHGSLIYNTNLYATAVAECIAQETPLSLSATCRYDEGSRSLTVNISANAPEKVSGKLEVWLVEDNITDTQLMADGTANQQYVHNHVFRRTLTADIYGDPVTIDAGKPATAAYTTTVDDAWKSENLAVVVFVSNPSGIVQVIKTTL